MQESHQHMMFVVIEGLKETVLATLPMKCNCFSELTQLFSEGIASFLGTVNVTLPLILQYRINVKLDGRGGKSKTGSIED